MFSIFCVLCGNEVTTLILAYIVIDRGIESEEEEDADSESEANLMKELKALYNSKETKPVSTALSKKQSPKQPKRKINTPKKAKVKKDSSKLR